MLCELVVALVVGFDVGLLGYFLDNVLKKRLNEISDFSSRVPPKWFLDTADEYTNRHGVISLRRYEICQAYSRVLLPFHADTEFFAGFAPARVSFHEDMLVLVAHRFDEPDFFNFVATDAFETQDKRCDFNDFNSFQNVLPQNRFPIRACLYYSIFCIKIQGVV